MRLVEIESEYLYIYIYIERERELFITTRECSFSRVLIFQSLTTLQFFSIFYHKSRHFLNPFWTEKWVLRVLTTTRWTPGAKRRRRIKRKKSIHLRRSSITFLWLKNPLRVKASRDSSRACSDKYVFVFPISNHLFFFLFFRRSLFLSFFLSFFKNSPPRILHTFLVIYDKP